MSLSSNGFLLIDKPAGYTSNDILNILKKRFKVKKMGHTGTLDPFATGLLVVGIGKALKQIPHLNEDPKVYEATVKLGEATDTLDLTGTVIQTRVVPNLTGGVIKEKLAGLVGPQDQVPPMYSAKKQKGVRLYDLARKGILVERKPVKINIYKLEILNVGAQLIAPLHLSFRVSCSRGTYVRVFGETIAARLGTIGHLTALRRLASGPFRVEEACDPLGNWLPEEKIRLL